MGSLGFSIYKIMTPANIVLHHLFLRCFLQAYLILLGFALLHFEDNYFFFLMKVCGNPALNETVGTSFRQHLLNSCLCVTFW